MTGLRALSTELDLDLTPARVKGLLVLADASIGVWESNHTTHSALRPCIYWQTLNWMRQFALVEDRPGAGAPFQASQRGRKIAARVQEVMAAREKAASS